jgi:hypothetical protein
MRRSMVGICMMVRATVTMTTRIDIALVGIRTSTRLFISSFKTMHIFISTCRVGTNTIEQ